MAGFLIVNPRSGSARPTAEELADAARARGIEVHLFREGEDLEELARGVSADALGMAGGDGSLAPVAGVAIERGLPFVCVPFGTRNHFARDLGLDRDDPIAALDAFAGRERRVDVGRAGDRLFLNNVSLGMYALLVHEREKHRRRREALARARAILIALRHFSARGLLVDGEPLRARVVLVANNAYELDLLSVGERERLDEGRLHLYVATGILKAHWEERSGERFEVSARHASLRAAIDGEPARLQSPIEFRIEPRALRVLVPPA
ncbi:MAG TPA: diacylglycerol kinase family protein [Gaiellaceae bacterium]|nr:diacylglycerol kinase family protein [Gaiellaceae bacterium]